MGEEYQVILFAVLLRPRKLEQRRAMFLLKLARQLNSLAYSLRKVRRKLRLLRLLYAASETSYGVDQTMEVSRL